jgi:hypothetical protein
MTMTLDQALALCEHASPMPHLAGQALRVMRDEIARLNELTDRFSAAINEMTGPTFMGEPVLPHPDNTAVDAFAVAMKAKLSEARSKGRGGWQNKDDCPQQRLSDMLRAHVAKGDPRDVANFAMFLHQRGEAILPAEPVAQVDGIAQAAAYIQKKADDYAAENCSSEPDTGAPVYHFGKSGMEYHHTLIELAEEVADLTPLPAKPVAQGEAVAFKHPAAVRSAAKFLLERFENARCDSDGVSCCIRCSAVAMSRWAIDALDSNHAEWRPMDTAPRDGTMLRLLVQFEDHATEDTTEPAPTIGAYSEGAECWQFAGWCWSHDHFTEGKGEPVGWLPMLADVPAPGES